MVSNLVHHGVLGHKLEAGDGMHAVILSTFRKVEPMA